MWPLQQDRGPADENETVICRFAGIGMREIDPLDLVATSHEGLLVLDFDLTVRFAHRSFGDTFTTTPKDIPREKEGRQ
jgi:hypothetical protein